MIDQDEDGWTHNLTDDHSFDQFWSEEDMTSSARCSIVSSRTDTGAGFDYKIGDTLKMRSGYKVRESVSAKESLFAEDAVISDHILVEYASGQ